jgi:hypothetical protein
VKVGGSATNEDTVSRKFYKTSRAIVEDFTDWAGSLRNWRSSEGVEIRLAPWSRPAPVLAVGYVVNASRIADRRIILAGYRLADLLTRVAGI